MGKRRTDIDAKKDEIIRRYEAGESSREIGEDLGTSGRTILHRLSEWGVRTKYFKDLDTADIVQRYQGGEKVVDIAKSLNVSEYTILNRLSECGLKLRRGPARKYDDAEICQMYRDGMSVREIKEKTGAENDATFYAILKRNGVPVRLQRNKLKDPETRLKIIRLRGEGLTHEAIAKIMKINRNYIGEVLREEVEIERKKWQPAVTVQNGMSIAEMRDKNLTIDEIAEIKGIDRVDVFKELQGDL